MPFSSFRRNFIKSLLQFERPDPYICDIELLLSMCAAIHNLLPLAEFPLYSLPENLCADFIEAR